MHIVHHRPWPRHVARQQQINQLFERILDNGAPDAGTEAQWVPRVDVREETGRFVIFADLPGIEPDQIQVHMDKGVLSISGQRRPTVGASESSHYARTERQQGSFQRKFALPDSADAEGIAASGRNGVLEISIPKKAEASPRRIQVAVPSVQ